MCSIPLGMMGMSKFMIIKYPAVWEYFVFKVLLANAQPKVESVEILYFSRCGWENEIKRKAEMCKWEKREREILTWVSSCSSTKMLTLLWGTEIKLENQKLTVLPDVGCRQKSGKGLDRVEMEFVCKLTEI